MGGMDWQALPTVAAMLGIEDVETWIVQLTVIRDHGRE